MTPPDHVGDDPVPHAGGGSQGLSTARLTGLLNGTYASVVGLAGTGIDATGAADSTTAINALLSANPGKVARGVPGASYLISAPLVLRSGTTLDMTGCTVTLAAGSNCNMLQNTQVVANNGRDSQIRVVGGLWDRGANTGTGTGNHSIVFRRLDGVSVIGARFASTAGKYAVNFGDVTDYLAADLSFNVASDGVHVQGPAARGTIRNLYGTCGDDMVGVTAVDYAAYADVSGNISDLRIDSIHGNNVGTLMVKVVGGTGTTVRRVSISNVFGTCVNYPVSITDDTTGATDVSEITVAGVYAVPSNNNSGLVNLGCTAGKTVTLRDLYWTAATTGAQVVRVASSCVVTDLDVDGVYALTAPNASKLVEIDGTVTRLSVRGRAAYGTAGDAVYIAGTATVNRVDLDLDLDKSASAFTVASGAAVDAVSLKHLFQTGTTTNMVNLGHATNTVVSLGNVETNATTLVRSSGTGGNMRVRGGAIRAANGSVVGLVKTGSSGVKVNCPSFPVDQSILTPDDGDIVNNTNATPLNGTGPAIYNTAATKWKNLYSGTTS